MAQDAAAMTSGGDVTADEATPLPPVVVEAPSQPFAAKQKKPQERRLGRQRLGADGAPAGDRRSPARVRQRDGTAGVGVYTLGQLDLIGGSTITNEAM